MRHNSLSTLVATGLAAATLMASGQVLAYGAGDFFTRVGVAKVEPTSDNGSLAGGAFAVDVQDKTDFAFTLGYRFHDKVGIELLAALPFEHDIALNGDNLASTKHLPPTLTLQYYPLGGTEARVQPYVGAGINYTFFSDEELAIGELELDDSWGAAAQVGIDLLIDENWALNAAAWYIDIDTDATVNGAAAGTVEIDPLVVMGGLSYRF
ncbi:outer membrane beta-barrel protein [Halomonas qinghailakensis]|uniref:Outer membrane beta-barrel protein n=2 Tax=Halomonas TaxID=2745 RepID=A0AA46TR45_9GAMM|nr:MULTISPECIES: OmpW family outer membrane protein [Halomonas]UYO74817.1 outer membrane beta-barrel protein [Halomonas sp. ZZQ-149]UYV20254.1 outer membrane beta-barrel protein [Halomonas qaidamensis]